MKHETVTVYAVSSGEYSDYGIEAVFSTKENAKSYIGDRSCCDIEEWVLDAWVPKADAAWEVDMTLEGDVVKVKKLSHADDSYLRYWPPAPFAPPNAPHMLYMKMWADDENGAVKIANERRIAFLLKRDAEGGAS